MQVLGHFGKVLELMQLCQSLDDETRIDNHLRVLYPAYTQRTIARKRQVYQKLSARVPNSILQRITGLEQDVLAKFDHIPTAPLGDILNALHKMPLLDICTDKDPQKYLEELNSELLEERIKRRAKGQAHKEELVAAKKATSAVLNCLRSCNLTTRAQKRQWLMRVLGWVMESQAIPGTLCVSRISIPEGVLIRRGRPRGSKKRITKAA